MVNQIKIEGRLVKDVEEKKSKKGNVTYCVFTIANETQKFGTSFINCFFKGSKSEMKCSTTKGKLLAISGELVISKSVDTKNEKLFKYFTKIIVNQISNSNDDSSPDDPGEDFPF